LKNMPLRKAWWTWKEHTLSHEHKERLLNDREFLAGRIQRLESSLEHLAEGCLGFRVSGLMFRVLKARSSISLRFV
jgi:hypothetical protein